MVLILKGLGFGNKLAQCEEMAHLKGKKGSRFALWDSLEPSYLLGWEDGPEILELIFHHGLNFGSRG
jgi:hypothetical protein